MELDYMNRAFTEDDMRETMLTILEGLESFEPTSEKWHTYFRRLYLFSMGEFKTEVS